MFGRFTLQVPDAWHAVDPTFATGAVFAPIGWVTDRQPGPQCTPDSVTGHIGCHAPIDELDDGDLLVTLTETGGAPVGPFHADSTFAGLPAQRAPMIDSSCSPAGRGGVDLLVKEADRFLRLTTCFGPHSATARADAEEMIATASYSGG